MVYCKEMKNEIKSSKRYEIQRNLSGNGKFGKKVEKDTSKIYELKMA